MTNNRKHIALFVGQADESYQSRFITGFLRNAFALDMDVCVFSMYHKYQDTAIREKGETNIFTLMRPELFDGAVVLADTIQTAGAAEDLDEWLYENFHKPVLMIESQSRHFPSVYTDCRESIEALIDHLVTVHGAEDIAFLCGKQWHEHSQQRLHAVQNSLKKHGLFLPEDRIIYGDFWYLSGELCADRLLNCGKKLPDAVICANDCMAIGLCQAFEERGISVPEEIAVVSYDSIFEGQTSPKPITSAVIPAEELGEYSAGYMADRFAGRETPPFYAPKNLFMGESCGCVHCEIPKISTRRIQWGTVISQEGFDSVNNTMADDLISQTDLAGFAGTVYSHAFKIGAENFHLCLGDLWRYMGKSSDVHFGNDGYPDNMIYAVRFNKSFKDGIAGLDISFDSSKLLPDLFEEREKPRAVFFTPVFSENTCFGYAAVEYGDTARSYDETYRKWILLVSRGLEALRRYLEANRIQEQLNNLKSSKFAAINAAYENLDSEEKADYELVTKILNNNLFTYKFQPIVDTKDGSIFSYEALMRSNTDRNLPPLTIVRYADMQHRLVDIERATFMNVLNIVENNLEKLGGAKIFINSIPGIMLEDDDLRTVEGYLEKLSDNVVVELTEESQLADDELERLKSILQRHNIKIAVDDYGSGYSNVNNLLRYMPNFVKIDRALISEIQIKPQKQHFVKEIINFCHDNDILALAEGVETSEELRVAIILGADLIQGFYTGKPAPDFMEEVSENVRKEIAAYRSEFLAGSNIQRYIAGKTNRVSLSALTKESIAEIVVGKGAMIYKDITLYGSPGANSNLHINIENGYKGRITLENISLTNDRKCPAVEVGENSDVTLVLSGDNVLMNSGIIVPMTSKLTIEGDGNMVIVLNSTEFCGIGNLPDSSAGELIFAQSGTIEIKGHGNSGICIGSGKGGKIRMFSGQYILSTNGCRTVCIGSLAGDANVLIDSSNIIVDFTTQDGAAIGSVTGSSKISISKCTMKLQGDGSEIVGLGSVRGENAQVSVDISSLNMEIGGISLTGIGALRGTTKCEMSSTITKFMLSGADSLAVGGYSDDTYIRMNRCDAKWDVRNNLDTDCFAEEENFRIINGSGRFIVNGKEIQRANSSD
ncbi:MAG: EAL domain-containing protein [Ruminococcus sp.]|uniref:EAL domain-containing protein n=1 Tax=Ruminococcus sp. TaxID=41978 RepID=UPI0025E18789|nr:EAL domain-containing protein [Ruminococcus sp.]MBO4866016.1 EAL domain-containing protein [Ruminococcus sp.]